MMFTKRLRMGVRLGIIKCSIRIWKIRELAAKRRAIEINVCDGLGLSGGLP